MKFYAFVLICCVVAGVPASYLPKEVEPEDDSPEELSSSESDCSSSSSESSSYSWEELRLLKEEKDPGRESDLPTSFDLDLDDDDEKKNDSFILILTTCAFKSRHSFQKCGETKNVLYCVAKSAGLFFDCIADDVDELTIDPKDAIRSWSKRSNTPEENTDNLNILDIFGEDFYDLILNSHWGFENRYFASTLSTCAFRSGQQMFICGENEDILTCTAKSAAFYLNCITGVENRLLARHEGATDDPTTDLTRDPIDGIILYRRKRSALIPEESTDGENNLQSPRKML